MEQDRTGQNVSRSRLVQPCHAPLPSLYMANNVKEIGEEKLDHLRPNIHALSHKKTVKVKRDYRTLVLPPKAESSFFNLHQIGTVLKSYQQFCFLILVFLLQTPFPRIK